MFLFFSARAGVRLRSVRFLFLHDEVGTLGLLILLGGSILNIVWLYDESAVLVNFDISINFELYCEFVETYETVQTRSNTNR